MLSRLPFLAGRPPGGCGLPAHPDSLAQRAPQTSNPQWLAALPQRSPGQPIQGVTRMQQLQEQKPGAAARWGSLTLRRTVLSPCRRAHSHHPSSMHACTHKLPPLCVLIVVVPALPRGALLCCTGVSRRHARLLRAVDDDAVGQQAPAAEAQRLDLPFETDMKTFSGGSTGSTAAAAAGVPGLGPSESTLPVHDRCMDNSYKHTA